MPSAITAPSVPLPLAPPPMRQPLPVIDTAAAVPVPLPLPEPPLPARLPTPQRAAAAGIQPPALADTPAPAISAVATPSLAVAPAAVPAPRAAVAAPGSATPQAADATVPSTDARAGATATAATASTATQAATQAATGPATAAGPRPPGAPDAGPRVGHDVATAPSLPASAARLNLELVRPRGGPVSVQGPRGLLPVLPHPPEQASKLARDIQRAGQPDCREAYSGMGLLAVVPLVADAVRDKGCRW